MRNPALLLLALMITAMVVYGFSAPTEEQQIMVVRYAEVFGGGRKSIIIVKPDGSMEVVDLDQGSSEEKMAARLVRLQQVLSTYHKEGWHMSTSVSNSIGGGTGWFQDHFLVK